jgi:hypothetical protein
VIHLSIAGARVKSLRSHLSTADLARLAGQKIALGRIHARQVVTVHVAAETITIDLDDQDSRTVRRTTTQPVRSIKAAQSRKAAHIS